MPRSTPGVTEDIGNVKEWEGRVRGIEEWIFNTSVITREDGESRFDIRASNCCCSISVVVKRSLKFSRAEPTEKSDAICNIV